MRTKVSCAWCDAADSLELEWMEMGTAFYLCSCCAKRTRVLDGVATRVIVGQPVDIQGRPIDEDA